MESHQGIWVTNWTILNNFCDKLLGWLSVKTVLWPPADQIFTLICLLVYQVCWYTLSWLLVRQLIHFDGTLYLLCLSVGWVNTHVVLVYQELSRNNQTLAGSWNSTWSDIVKMQLTVSLIKVIVCCISVKILNSLFSMLHDELIYVHPYTCTSIFMTESHSLHFVEPSDEGYCTIMHIALHNNVAFRSSRKKVPKR